MKVRRDEFTFASVDCGTIFPSFIVLAVRDAVIHFLFAFCLLVIQTLICLTEQFSYDGLTKITTHFVICKGLRGTVTSRFSNSYYISNIKVSLQHLLICFGLKNSFFLLLLSFLYRYRRLFPLNLHMNTHRFPTKAVEEDKKKVLSLLEGRSSGVPRAQRRTTRCLSAPQGHRYKCMQCHLSVMVRLATLFIDLVL